MKALVTGSDGFVGPYLVNLLQSTSNQVISLNGNDGPNLLDPEAWIENFRKNNPDVVYHLAGWSNVASSWEEPQKCFDINASGTLAVLNAARLNKIPKVIIISSAEVYDQSKEALTEESKLNPATPYGASKLASEVISNQYSIGYELDISIARPFNHIGPGQSQDFVASRFAAQIAMLEKRGGGKLLHGNLDASRDFCDVRDVVRGYTSLAELGKNGETYNICSGKPVTIKHLLEIMIDQAKVPIETELDQDKVRPSDCPIRVGSSEKINRQTGWEPKIELATTISDILEEQRHKLNNS